MEVTEVFVEFLQQFLAIPDDDYDVHESQIMEMFLGTEIEKALFQVSHEYVCILWNYMCK